MHMKMGYISLNIMLRNDLYMFEAKFLLTVNMSANKYNFQSKRLQARGCFKERG